jgi:hypothetical protein
MALNLEDNWHLDKKVTMWLIGLIVVLSLALSGNVIATTWWASRLDTLVSAQGETLKKHEAILADRQRESIERDKQISALVAGQMYIIKSLDSIAEKIDRK